jgi:hypothetical protein
LAVREPKVRPKTYLKNALSYEQKNFFNAFKNVFTTYFFWLLSRQGGLNCLNLT